VARFFGLKPKKTGEYLMAEEFLSDSTGSARPNSEPEKPEREPLRFMIIGSREGVKEQIQDLRNWHIKERFVVAL
jgi:hypothetical protein